MKTQKVEKLAHAIKILHDEMTENKVKSVGRRLSELGAPYAYTAAAIMSKHGYYRKIHYDGNEVYNWMVGETNVNTAKSILKQCMEYHQNKRKEHRSIDSTVRRYYEILNQTWIDAHGGNIRLIKEYRKNYNISNRFFTELIARNILHKDGLTGKYEWTIGSPTIDLAKSIHSTMYEDKKNYKTKNLFEHIENNNGNKISDIGKKHEVNSIEIFTDQELFDEIKRRGYTGGLDKKIII